MLRLKVARFCPSLLTPCVHTVTSRFSLLPDISMLPSCLFLSLIFPLASQKPRCFPSIRILDSRAETLGSNASQILLFIYLFFWQQKQNKTVTFFLKPFFPHPSALLPLIQVLPEAGFDVISWSLLPCEVRNYLRAPIQPINTPLTPPGGGMEGGETWQCGSHEASLRIKDSWHIAYVPGNIGNSRNPRPFVLFPLYLTAWTHFFLTVGKVVSSLWVLLVCCFR